MRIRKEIIEADKIISEASMSLPFRCITPINAKKVKQDFLKGKIKNPELKYTEPTGNLLELRRKISRINIEERDVVDSFVIEKQMDVIRKIDLINCIGCFDFTERSRKIYGVPKKALLNKAYEILNKPLDIQPAKKIPSLQAAKLIRANLKQFNLKYKIKKENIITSAVIYPAKHQIILKKKARFSGDFVNRLIVHEIGTHAFRFENGALQKLGIFKHGLANYLETEEGLAIFNEERFGVLRDSYFKNYAGRVIAVNAAQENSFYQTFREVRRFFQKKTAFDLTLRAKRGIADTRTEGGYTKDHVYLKGYYNVKKFAEKGNIKDLYVGKVGIKDLPYIKRLKLKKPKLLPKTFTLNE